MRTLPNMALTMWDQIEDLYDHVQLATNFAKLDAHDHTPGRGVQLTTESIETGSITTPLLATAGVTKEKLSSELQTDIIQAVTGSTIGVYEAPVARTRLVEYEPSATRPVLVNLTAVTGGAEAEGTFSLFVHVDGVEVKGPEIQMAASKKVRLWQTFLVKPKGKWMYESPSYTGSNVTSQYLVL